MNVSSYLSNGLYRFGLALFELLLRAIRGGICGGI